MPQAKLTDRLHRLQWLLPILILCLAVFHQLGPAYYVEQVYGEWAHYILEVLFYGITGPFVMWYTLRTVRSWAAQKELAEAEVYRLNTELQKRDKERNQLLKEIIRVQEEERKRIARELHDDFAQTLAALNINLETVLQNLPPAMDALKAHMSRVQELTMTTLEQTHEWIQDLRPRILDDLGLLPALRWYAESKVQNDKTHVHLDASGFHWRISPELETALFRAIQEALSNVVAHAQARQVTISLVSAESRVIAEVDDDGVGFDPQELLTVHEGMRGIGLLGMRERIALVGGQLTIESKPGGGTHIRIEVPWNL